MERIPGNKPTGLFPGYQETHGTTASAIANQRKQVK